MQISTRQVSVFPKEHSTDKQQLDFTIVTTNKQWAIKKINTSKSRIALSSYQMDMMLKLAMRV